MDHVILWLRASSCISPAWQVWCHRHCYMGDLIILTCHETFREHAFKGLWYYGWKSLMVSDHSAKFGRHFHCGSGNTMFSIFQVIFQDHVIKGNKIKYISYVGSLQSKLSPCHNRFSLPSDFSRPRNQSAMQL